jgi:exopolysaccharide biosynthesis polyprenyl glycosylphosphotransferase
MSLFKIQEFYLEVSMFRRFSVNFAIISILLDTLIIAVSFYSANILRPLLNALPFSQLISEPINIPILLYILLTLIWVLIFLLLSLYDGRRNLYFIDELTTLTIGSILAGVSMAGTLYLSFREVSRLLFISFIVIAYVGMLLWRLVVRLFFRFRKGNSNQIRRVLIVGAGPVGNELSEKIGQHPYLGLNIRGFLDDDPEKASQNNKVIGSLTDAKRVIHQYKIDDVVIALPRRAYEKVNRLVAELHDIPVKVLVIPDYFHLALHKAAAEEFAGIPMLDLRAPAINEYQRLVKRIFDLCILSISLPFSLVLLGFIIIAIYIESPGPILFRQKRVGENGKLFEMLKFRTMVPNAEKLRNIVEYYDEEGQLIHKIASDPRVTRIGKILRRTSLDELPQIINILKGEMSLVGPRPEIPYLVENYKPWQHKRFVVPQGLTGWWQVNGRSDKPMHLHTEDDLYYIQNYSLLLDLKILIKTILVVFRGSGAF